MGYFPFFVDISGKKCLIAGGGRVALRKIERLLDYSPEITVVSPEICPEIAELSGIRIIRREFSDSDIDGAFMVIAATDDSALNAHIYQLCNDRNIPVNSVDDKEHCSFIFPALVHRGDITIGISTGGTSPLFAQFIRQTAEEWLDDYHLGIAKLLSAYRPVVRERFDTEKKRKEALNAIFDLCLTDDKLPDDEEIQQLLEAIDI
ncbi:MAG: bifunctional precorrin-2 dehydrogenase/sirohydrochlorin ferrochelatase [Ruminococcus sp.]|nr:bifunctional precorrin-2 dehydrogenase/sirohydrochlorin ferrochelatase [Ruminococcus sp.]